MSKKGIVIALFCIISFSPLSVMAGGNGAPIEKGSAGVTINAEAYIVEWESGNMVLKRTAGFDRFMSMPPYEAADAALSTEAYVAEWDAGKMVLKRTDSFDRFMSMPPYEISEEAYSIDRDSTTMRPTLKSDNINRLISMPPYEASADVTSYSHSNILSAGVSQPSEPSSDPEASSAPQQCDWCYEQTS